VTQSSQHLAVHLERIIDASTTEVYDAWLDPDMLRIWLAPGGIQIAKAEVEMCVGGRYRIWHTAGGKSVGGFECEITELVPDKRIAFRWGFVGPERTDGPVFDSRLTISLEKAPGNRTRLLLVHEQLDDLAAAMPQVAEQVRGGWESVLAKLEEVFLNQERPNNA
jgi:uncharacterized protein YndB with AHSA1/START domain